MDIKTSKKISSQAKKVKHTTGAIKHKVWTGTYIVFALVCIAAYFLFRLQFFNFLQAYRNFILNFLLGAFFSFLVLIASKIIEGIVTKVSHTKAVVYNMVRLIRLFTILIVIFIFISFLINNWYSLFVSLGLFSLILGFSLQTPVSSLIGWFYIVIRAPYKVGDRIQVTEFTGDVVEINYFDTTLWEFAGEYMTNDLPSGRLIRFPNSIVWQSAVYNYSWQKFPYIWNEIPFHIAYETDLAYVEKTIRTVAKKELGEGMEENVKELRNLIKQTPVDELEIVEYPFVNFRINANTWVEALLVYLVEPKKAAAVRSELIKKILEAFSNQPDKILFPKSNSR
jgi:small-conductance mechanosensitive channel